MPARYSGRRARVAPRSALGQPLLMTRNSHEKKIGVGILQGAETRGLLEGAPWRTPRIRKSGQNAYTHFAGGLRTQIAS